MSTLMKTMLQLRDWNSERRVWKARTSVGQTKEKAAGMKRIRSQGDEVVEEGSGGLVGEEGAGWI